MEVRINPSAFEIFALGSWIAQLSHSVEKGHPWGMTKVCLTSLSTYKNIQTLDFIGASAEDELKEIAKCYSNDDEPITSVHSDLLKMQIENWRERIEEASKSWVISCPITDLDISKLRGGPESFLTHEEWQMLTPLEQEALHESISCLLSNSFTSAEFMSLKLAESLLRRWYKKKARKEPETGTWFAILDKLNEEFNKAKRPKELSLLDYFSERRNEIARPGIISRLYQAETTFLNVITLCKAAKTQLL